MAETVDKISEHIERLVQLIHGDELKIAEAEELDELDQTDAPSTFTFS